MIFAEIGGMRELVDLDVGTNKLQRLPEELGQVKTLERLAVRWNKLEALPESLGNLTALRDLYAEHNAIVRLPDTFGGLASLKDAYLTGNQLAELPVALTRLLKLELLDVAKNQVTSLPEQIGDCESLRRICAGKNRLTSIPESVQKLMKLDTLDLHDNQLTRIPSMGHLNLYLSSITLSGNPLDLETLDPPELRDRIRQQMKGPAPKPVAAPLQTFGSAFGMGLYRAADGREVWLKPQHEGTLEIKSGAIVALDPVTFSNSLPFVRRVSPGTYPVWSTELEGEYACLSIELDSKKQATTWVPAEIEGGAFSYGVDAGVGGFVDLAALKHFESGVAEKAADFEGGVEILGSKHGDLVGCRSGMGDGSYASYWGLDDSGTLVALLTDFQLVRWDLPASPPATSAQSAASPTPVPTPPPTPPPTPTPSTDGPWRFELVDGSSQKFWEVKQEGPSFTVRFGKLGSQGQAKTKTLDSADEAATAVEKLVREKTRGGYKEV